MGTITIRKNEDILEIRKRIMRDVGNTKALSVKKYSGRLKLKEEPLVYQKRVRKEWNEHTR
jgi:hypothetical protein